MGRSILLGSLGRHREALALHLYMVGEISGALEYCSKHYASNISHDKEENNPYTLLYGLLVKPPDRYELRKLSLPENTPTPTHVNAGIELLRQTIVVSWRLPKSVHAEHEYCIFTEKKVED